MTNNPRFGLALEYVSDIEAVKRFYVDVVGLTVERDHPTFVQFKEDAGARFAIVSDEPMDPSGARELYWTVDDAQAAYDDLSHKAEVSVPLTEKPFGKYFGIKDPSGQPIYLIELSANRPSELVQ